MSHEKGQEKADIHDLEYKTRRQVRVSSGGNYSGLGYFIVNPTRNHHQDQLDKGYRRSSIYRKERLPESTSCEKPKLPIVLKGKYISTLY